MTVAVMGAVIVTMTLGDVRLVDHPADDRV